MSINPADCDRTTVYAGECRNFADTEWLPFESGRRRSPDARDGNTWLIDLGVGSVWTRDDKVRNLVPLVPERDTDALLYRAERAERERDEAVRACDELRGLIEGQKEHVSKSIEVRNRMRRERDAAVARAEEAEKRHTWPKTTPTGHTYIAPDTYSALCHQHGNAAQAAVESWDADECPPEPTWEMVGIARREVERLAQERDGWRAAAEHRSGLTEQLTPAVSHADIEKAIDRWKLTGQSRGVTLADDLHALVSGADPAVHVVRESHIAAVSVKQGPHGAWTADGEFVAVDDAEQAGHLAREYLTKAVRRFAVRRAIEAEQAEGRVEQKARELWESTIAEGAGVADWEDAHEDAQNQFRILARREGQAEAFDEGWKARASRDPLHHPDRDHTAPPPPNGLNPYRQEAGR